MDSVYLTLLSKVNAAGQLQLLRFWNSLSPSDQLKLADQILKLDLLNLNNMFKDAQMRRHFEGEVIPVDSSKVASTLTSSQEERSEWRKIGMDAITKNEVGVILLSGGQGTRLGSSSPKALFDIGLPSKKTLLQIQAEKIKKLESMTGGKLPWYIMTSAATHLTIKESLVQASHYGLDEEQVKVFNQGFLPCLSDEGDILLLDPCSLAVSPDGNGGLFKALKDEGILADMKLKKLKHIFVYCVDNVLVKIADPEFIGYCIKQEVACGNKVVRRVDGENVGVTAMLSGIPGVVEYSEIPDEVKDAKTPDGNFKFNAANICVHYFSMDFLEEAVEKEELLPVHLARKKIPHVTEAGILVNPDIPNGVKLEKFVFDAFQFVDADKFALFECDRDEEFEPLKSATGSRATPMHCLSKLSTLHAKWIVNAGAELIGPDGDSLIKEDLDKYESDKIPKDIKVEVSPAVSYAGEGLERLVHGKALHWPLYLSENKQYF